MNELIEKARKKIEEEVNNSKDSYIKIIGQYLLKQIDINAEAAKEINEGNKTLEKAFKEVTKVAKNKAINGCAVLEDEEVFGIIRNYFEIEAVQDKMIQLETEEIKEKHNIVEEKQKNEIDFDYSLEDFM